MFTEKGLPQRQETGHGGSVEPQILGLEDCIYFIGSCHGMILCPALIGGWGKMVEKMLVQTGAKIDFDGFLAKAVLHIHSCAVVIQHGYM